MLRARASDAISAYYWPVSKVIHPDNTSSGIGKVPSTQISPSVSGEPCEDIPSSSDSKETTRTAVTTSSYVRVLNHSSVRTVDSVHDRFGCAYQSVMIDVSKSLGWVYSWRISNRTRSTRRVETQTVIRRGGYPLHTASLLD